MAISPPFLIMAATVTTTYKSPVWNQIKHGTTISRSASPHGHSADHLQPKYWIEINLCRDSATAWTLLGQLTALPRYPSSWNGLAVSSQEPISACTAFHPAKRKSGTNIYETCQRPFWLQGCASEVDHVVKVEVGSRGLIWGN